MRPNIPQTYCRNKRIDFVNITMRANPESFKSFWSLWEQVAPEETYSYQYWLQLYERHQGHMTMIELITVWRKHFFNNI